MANKGLKNLLVIVACAAVVVVVLISESQSKKEPVAGPEKTSEEGNREDGQGGQVKDAEEIPEGWRNAGDPENHEWIDESLYREDASDTYSEPEWNSDMEMPHDLYFLNPEQIIGKTQAEIEIFEMMIQNVLERNGIDKTEWIKVNPDSYKDTEEEIFWEGMTDAGTRFSFREHKETGQIVVEMQ